MTIEEMRKLLPCKMTVKYYGDPRERIVLDIFNDGSCRYVAGSQNENYFNGDYYLTNIGGECKPLPQKTKRLANRKEWLKWSAKVTHELATGVSDDVWVVHGSFGTPRSQSWGQAVTTCWFTPDNGWWRAKLGDNGEPTEWEQFWIEE